MVSTVTSTVILLPFLTITRHESGIRKIYVFVSDRIYRKNVSRPCSLAAQIEPVQCNYILHVIQVLHMVFITDSYSYFEE